MGSSSYDTRFKRSKRDDFLFSKSDVLIIPTWSQLSGTTCPSWYKPQEHWLPWISKALLAPKEDDPLGFLFVEPVRYEEVAEEFYSIDSKDSNPDEGKTRDVGYRVVPEWATLTVKHASPVIRGDRPTLEETQKPLWVHENEEDVQNVVVLFKRSCLSVLGFLTWISSLIAMEEILDSEDALFVRSLYLGAQEKIGVLYQLERDYHEANFPHLLEHGIPIHGVLTEDMKKDWQFMRLYQENQRASRLREKIHRFESGSNIGIINFHLYRVRWIECPEIVWAYWERFSAVKHSAKAPAGVRTLYILYRQNLYNLGEPPVTRNRCSVHSVDLEDFGVIQDDETTRELEAFYEKTSVLREQAKNLSPPPKPLLQRMSLSDPLLNRRRSYSPSDRYDRGPPSRPLLDRLEFSGHFSRGGTSSSLDREQVGAAAKTVSFSSDAIPSLGARAVRSRMSYEPERPQALQDCVDANMDDFLADDRSRPKIIILPAGSPSQFGLIPAPRRAITPYPHAEMIARDEIQRWSDLSLEASLGYPRYKGLQWNCKWLEQGKLVCSTHSALKLKSLVTLHPEVKEIPDLLETAIRFGIPFSIFIKRSSVREYRDIMIPSLILKTMGSIYEPGFQDVTLEWSRGRGSAAAFNAYKSNVGTFLS
ncbi:hypothetical protein K438DRAFT_2132201 [Mycena galopus ATCC 62051]|nr:hypothetical protein K438DRAFT_2132201 [Mycena galopus ATCC 62051]